MSKPLFTDDDFDLLRPNFPQSVMDNVVRCANAKVIKEGKVVYGMEAMGEYFNFGNTSEPHSPSRKTDNRTALLICIEPIEKPECKHGRIEYGTMARHYHTAFCNDCHEYLKPLTWEVSK